MKQDRFEEATVLAEALQHGLQEVREDVTTLVAAEVRRAGLTTDETRQLIQAVVREELDRRARVRTGFKPWVPAAVSGFVAGVAAAAATLVLAGATPF